MKRGIAMYIQQISILTLRLLGSAAVCLAIAGSDVFAAPVAGEKNEATTQPSSSNPLIATGLDNGGQIRLFINGSRLITTSRPYKRVSIGRPEVASLNPLTPTSALLTANKTGFTQLIVWDNEDHSQVVDVNVQFDARELQQQYRQLFPETNIEVSGSNGTVLLRGRVPNLVTAEQAVQVAAPYGKVLNLLEVSGGQQVMLQVRFAEVSRSASTSLGVNLGYSDGTSFGASNVGQVNPFAIRDDGTFASTNVNSSVTLFGRAEIGSTAVEFFVDALRQNNLLRILAEPNLIAISGEQANFLAGGEFPIPVPQGGAGINGTTITIEFKEFGVKLNFVPVVLGNGVIRMKVAPEVSDLDFTTAVRFNGFVVPGLMQRRLSTTIEVVDGQTFALAGLLNSNVIASKNVTPLLGDIPVLGALFRSVRYQRKETELVVFVTPRLVTPMNPDQVPPLPGEKWRHPTEGELFLNQDIGGTVPSQYEAAVTRGRATNNVPPLHQGQWGFTPATMPSR